MHRGVIRNWFNDNRGTLGDSKKTQFPRPISFIVCVLEGRTMQYKNTSIHINYSDYTDEERAAALARRTKAFYASDAAKQHAREMAEAIRKYGKNGVYDDKPRELEHLANTVDRRIEEIKSDKGSTGEWEREVVKHLDRIMITQIGGLLVRSMKSSVKVWIVVDSSPEGAAASTTPGELPASSGGGVRLYFDPFGFPLDSDRYTAADILFHELVHAYRSAWMGIKGSNWRQMREYKTAEEFLAVHLQNVFMSQIGKNKFYLAHENNQVASVAEVYENIARTRETMEVLGYFLYREPFARMVAKWTQPVCNVWRDYSKILARSPFRKSLPAVPTP